MTEEHTHISDEMWKKYAQGTLSTKEEEKLYTDPRSSRADRKIHLSRE